jgi:hypothetical protein
VSFNAISILLSGMSCPVNSLVTVMCNASAR